jgi:quercetin dioxygenase-like cupin family protein
MPAFASLALFVILGLAIGPVACLAQDEVAVNPEMVKVEFENEQIRVLRVSIGAHQKTAVHSHPSRFGVAITKNDLRVYSPDGTSKTSKRTAHEHFWSDPVTHRVENLSDQPMQNIEIELKRANRAAVDVKSATIVSKAQGTPTDPVAVEQEPHHHVIFENQYVRVMEVIVAPGETTLFHKHSLDNVPVFLSDAAVKRQSVGEDWVAAPAKEGSVGFTAGTKTPYVHRITNAGATVFHVLDVEILP